MAADNTTCAFHAQGCTYANLDNSALREHVQNCTSRPKRAVHPSVDHTLPESRVEQEASANHGSQHQNHAYGQLSSDIEERSDPTTTRLLNQQLDPETVSDPALVSSQAESGLDDPHSSHPTRTEAMRLLSTTSLIGGILSRAPPHEAAYAGINRHVPDASALPQPTRLLDQLAQRRELAALGERRSMTATPSDPENSLRSSSDLIPDQLALPLGHQPVQRPLATSGSTALETGDHPSPQPEQTSRWPCTQCGNHGDYNALNDEHQAVCEELDSLRVDHSCLFRKWQESKEMVEKLEAEREKDCEVAADMGNHRGEEVRRDRDAYDAEELD
jgi:hypothetical protein